MLGIKYSMMESENSSKKTSLAQIGLTDLCIVKECQRASSESREEPLCGDRGKSMTIHGERSPSRSPFREATCSDGGQSCRGYPGRMHPT